MKKILLTLTVFIALTTSTRAEGFLSDTQIWTRLGYNIGGTAPVGLPASIRALNKFAILPNLQIGVEVAKPLSETWGIETGLRLENKAMEIDAEVKNYIPVAEKIWVKPLIGHALFDEIEQQVKDNEVSEENATLLTEGGLWQYLAFATVYEALPTLWAHISEVGITKGKSDNSDSLDLKDMTYMSQHLRNQVEVLKDQLKKWICERAMYFPKADLCSCNCEGCCKHEPQLNAPNPQFQVYGTPRKPTRLR